MKPPLPPLNAPHWDQPRSNTEEPNQDGLSLQHIPECIRKGPRRYNDEAFTSPTGTATNDCDHYQGSIRSPSTLYQTTETAATIPEGCEGPRSQEVPPVRLLKRPLYYRLRYQGSLWPKFFQRTAHWNQAQTPSWHLP